MSNIMGPLWSRSYGSGFTTTYAISAYHHQRCEFESHSLRGVLDTYHGIGQAHEVRVIYLLLPETGILRLILGTNQMFCVICFRLPRYS